MIQDIRSHKDVLCNAILFVGRSVCVAQYQSLYDATIPCSLLCGFVFILKLPNVCCFVSGLLI